MSNFWEQPLDTLNDEQWEALCDGCAQCCLIKLEDDETRDVFYTQISCQLLDINQCRCSDYKNRQTRVKECAVMTKENINSLMPWLPDTCAYKRRKLDLPLFDWHYLISGDRNTVHKEFFSIRDWAIPQQEVDVADYQDYVIDIDK